MKKLTIYTLLFISPFIVSLIGLEILLRNIPNNYKVKGDFLKKGSQNIKIIILGSSHGIIGIDPDGFSKKTFNLANYSQTLNIDYEILNKYHSHLDSLEYIILPLSYHLLWSKLEGERCKYYNLYYDINSEKNPLKLFLFQDSPMRLNFKKIKDHYFNKPKPRYTLISKGYNKTGTAETLVKIEKYSKLAVPAHTTKDLTFRYKENIEYLKNILKIGEKRNVKIILVTTPVHESYAKNLNIEQLDMMYSIAYDLVDDINIFYYNGLNDFNKTDADKNNFKLYSDADHLSHIGAERFTHKLDSIIEQIESNTQFNK